MPGPDNPAVVDAAAAAILNGTPIDWPSLEARASASERELLEELRLLCTVADLHRDFPHAEVGPESAREGPAHYWGRLRLIERIGGGSFGDVYRAWDPRLRREVALKLIEIGRNGESRSASIIREGRLLARVRHPGVVTIYDAERIGDRVGLSMEFVDGPTLEARIRDAGTLPADKAIEVGRQLCQALAAAHAAGVLHRDVKAANVLVRDDGRVVLMDFGAGRELEEADGGATGTPMYLAPEVLAGGEATVRSDVYSLGVLLHYVHTGKYPVQAASLPALREAHARRLGETRATPLLGINGRLASVIARAVDPRPERRFESAAAFESALTAAARSPLARLLPAGLAAAAALLVMTGAWGARVPPFDRWRAPAEPVRIAIMPFEITPIVDEAADAALRERLARELILRLQTYDGLRVIAAESALSIAPLGLGADQIGEKLGAETVITGTLARESGSHRINVRLVRAGGTSQTWERSYEAASDLSGVQRSIIEDIASEMRVVPRAGRQWPTWNPAAHAFYVRALAEQDRTLGPPQHALKMLQQALTLDPGFAAAHAAAAEMYLQPGNPEALRMATESAARAMSLEPSLPASHLAAAVIRSAHGDWAGADRAYREAVTLGPSDVMVRVHFAHWLSRLGRFDEALAHAREAERLDPYSPRVIIQVASVLRFARQWEAAIAQTNRILAIDPTYSLAYLNLGHSLQALGRLDEAIPLYEKHHASVGNRGDAYAEAGRTDDARRLVAQLEKRYAETGSRTGEIAQIYCGLREIDRAFEWLNKLEPHGTAFPTTFLVARVWDPLRGDPRFAELLKRHRLDPDSLTGF